MSNYSKTLVQFTDGQELSTPFLAYVESKLTGPVVVCVSEETGTNPETGEIRQSIKVAGMGLVVSHDPQWFNQNLSGWTDEFGKGVVVPFAEEDPADVLARVRAARSK
jgi:hypothetical protein